RAGDLEDAGADEDADERRVRFERTEIAPKTGRHGRTLTCPRHMKVSVVIPAFNESATIARTLADVREYFTARSIPFEIIIVVEGTDGTERIARDVAGADGRVRVIGHTTRLGKGAAVKNGVLAATGDVV